MVTPLLGRWKLCAVTVTVTAALLEGCPRPAGHRVWLGTEGQLELVDTLPGFLMALKLSSSNVPEGPMAAWTEYERKHASLLGSAGALEEDPGDARLRKLAVSPAAVASLVEAFEAAAVDDLSALAKDLTVKLGAAPRMVIAFVALRSNRTLHRGTLDGKAVLLLNARHPDLTTRDVRQSIIAREVFTQLHREREPDSASLGPVARRLYRDGAALFAVRQLVPRAFEHQVLGLNADQLARLKARQALVAKELLASLDTGRESESVRFFDPAVNDPLLPSGAGIYVADRVFQRLATEMGSTTRPLQLSSAEFLTRARRHLVNMASGN